MRQRISSWKSLARALGFETRKRTKSRKSRRLTLEPLEPRQLLTTVSLDNGDAGFSATAPWAEWSGEGFQDDEHYAPAGSGDGTAMWTLR
jgi:hypothetical protein